MKTAGSLGRFVAVARTRSAAVLVGVVTAVLTASGAGSAPAGAAGVAAAQDARLTLTMPTTQTWGKPVTLVASGFAVAPSTLEVYDLEGTLPCPSSPDLLVNNPAYGSISPTRVDMPDSIPAGNFSVSDPYGSGPPAGLHRICGWLAPGNAVANVIVREGPPTATATPTPAAPGGRGCYVQPFVGTYFSSAKAVLLAAGCKLGKVTTRSAAAIKKGVVLAQSPKPGTKLKLGGKISFVVGN